MGYWLYDKAVQEANLKPICTAERLHTLVYMTDIVAAKPAPQHFWIWLIGRF